MKTHNIQITHHYNDIMEKTHNKIKETIYFGLDLTSQILS